MAFGKSKKTLLIFFYTSFFAVIKVSGSNAYTTIFLLPLASSNLSMKMQFLQLLGI